MPHRRRHRAVRTPPPRLVLLAASAVLASAPARAIDGTYLGTYQETDLGGDVDPVRTLEHRTDLRGRRVIAPGVDGELRANLRYSSRPGEEDTALMRSRLFGDAMGSAWRVHGQWVPWQDRTAGPGSPRQEELSLGGQWRRAPLGTALALDWSRIDVQTLAGRSRNEDRRAELGRAWGSFRASTSWRRLDATPPAAQLATPSQTEEWRAAASFDRTWRKVTLTLDSDAVLSEFRSAARRREFHAEYMQAGTTWRALPRLSLSALGQLRKGESDDNALATPQPLDDRALSLGAEYRPLTGLTLSGSREHRRRESAAADEVVTDYVRLSARLDRQLTRRSTLQTGYEHSVDLAGDDAEIPRNNLFALVEARIAPGITGRADARTQNSPLSGVEGRTWRYGTQLALRPTEGTRLDAEYARERQPAFEGIAQREHEWVFTGGWTVGLSNVVSSLRIRDGSGRIERHEKTWALTSAWRLARGAQVSLDASRRDSEALGAAVDENTWGVGVTAPLPRETRLTGSLRRVERTGQPRSLVGTVTLDVDFNLGGAS